jgi:hypothetical protein
MGSFTVFGGLANFDVLYLQIYWRVERYILQGPEAIEGRFERAPKHSDAVKSVPKGV